MPPVQTKDEQFMFALIRAAFCQRRKTLVNALANSPETGLNKETVLTALERAGKSATVRGEALSLKEFALLADILSL